MVNVRISSYLALALAASTVNAVPVILTKRIAQVIADSTTKWEQACIAAGGGQQCNPLSVAAFSTLLAAAGNCDQQNAADNMIDLAKTLNNDPTMIKFTQIFVQQARNTPNSVAVPYCQTAPRNAELNGLFQCQFQGANQKVFVGNLQLGQPGTIPFGKSAPLNPLGSCLANPSGPIADGSQLTDITSDPGVSGSSSSTSSSSSSNDNKGSTSVATTAASTSTSASSSSSDSSSSSGDSSSSSSDSSSSSGDSSSSSGFQLQNAKDAQALNAKFATLTADSTCSDGDEACVNGAFAQCIGGKFQTTPCAASLTCLALPLVNKAGTSITCDTQADAIARIQAAGGSASLTGDGSSASSSDAATGASSDKASTSQSNTSSSSSSSSSTGSFQLQNAKDAQALNAQFASLSADSACTDGQQACVKGGFAQCVGGKFEITQCAQSLTCVALPLVDKAGTSITCDTEADAIARMQAAGASASLT